MILSNLPAELTIKLPGILVGGLLTLLFAAETLIGNGAYELYRPNPVAPASPTLVAPVRALRRGVTT